MRIIKGNFTTDDLVKILAGEMLNIENSVFHYLDGKPRPMPKQGLPKDYIGYPRIVDGNVVNIMSATVGYVYLPVTMKDDIMEVLEKLTRLIQIMEEEMVRPDGKPLNKLHNFQYASGNSARFMVKSNQVWTRNVDGKNVKRFITNGNPSDSYARFVWKIHCISEVPLSVTSDNVNTAVSAMCNSVFADLDDVTPHAHNDVVFDLNSIHGMTDITDVVINLCAHENSLIMEMSRITKSHSYSDAPADKLRRGAYHQFQLQEVEHNGEKLRDVCSLCRSPLYGECYVILYPYVVGAFACCPLCVHSSGSPGANCKAWEAEFIIRVTAPRTLDDVLNDEQIKNGSSPRLDVLREVHKNGWERGVHCVFIGEKYAMFMNVREYLFSPLEIKKEVAGRKIVFGQVHTFGCSRIIWTSEEAAMLD